MRADGSELQNISQNPAHDGLPTWSPDGRWLAFFSSRGLDHDPAGPIPGHVYVVAAAGGEPRRVTRRPLSSTLGPYDWSDDGCCLLLTRADRGDTDIVPLDVESGQERGLATTQDPEAGGRFSPDGRWITYYSESQAGSALMRVPAAGGGPEVLRRSAGSDYYPYAWSPDGEGISVTWIGPEGDWELRAVRADGKEERVLLRGEDRPREGTWRPALPAGE